MTCTHDEQHTATATPRVLSISTHSFVSPRSDRLLVRLVVSFSEVLEHLPHNLRVRRSFADVSIETRVSSRCCLRLPHPKPLLLCPTTAVHYIPRTSGVEESCVHGIGTDRLPQRSVRPYAAGERWRIAYPTSVTRIHVGTKSLILSRPGRGNNQLFSYTSQFEPLLRHASAS